MENLLATAWKRATESTSDLCMVIAVSIGTFGIKRLRTWFKHRTKRKFKQGIGPNAKVQELLAELRAIYGADRAGLMQFHNGLKYFSGESSMKFTLTHVSLGLGVSYPLSSPSVMESVPVPQALGTIQAMKAARSAFFSSSDPCPDGFFQMVFAGSGTKSMLIAPVPDASGHWIGMVMVTWRSDLVEHPGQGEVREYAARIGSALIF